jgi:hypothetical protein
MLSSSPLCRYQLAFFIPGISPFQLSSLKQIRQSLNLRRYPPDLPQMEQRLYLRVENFGFLFQRFICDVLAIYESSSLVF